MNILFIADIVGKPGRETVEKLLPALKNKYNIDFVIANAENSAGGFGITPKIADFFFNLGVNVITMGNHIWDKKEIIEYLKTNPKILAAANFPPRVPGEKVYLGKIKNKKIAVFNLLGRVFMGNFQLVDCPFQAAERELENLKGKAEIIIIDIHAEATSEKLALGYFLDGKVSSIIGTHTHVSTTDLKILPKGTAYITDIGMTGPVDSILGVKKDIIINKFLTQMPERFEIAEGQTQFEGVIIQMKEEGGVEKLIRLQEFIPAYK